ncbi:hypothetical protein OpiT1DRAFT_04408 [Opitutaceae bacterium TAV1]|nr:hypothetical protein OPIT5_16425 [Opitutaceae bacterium TAV5]EIP99876.1 hypothetical protein OpiT1DRAFT_04408 [Opitutaceae bacterium TAV1]
MKTLPVLALALALIAPFAFAVIDSGSADSKAAASPGDTASCHSGGICAAPPAIPATAAAAVTAVADKSGEAPYPLTTCVISGKKLGAMGEPVTYVYKQKDQPDQTVKFCCKGCIGPFNKNPAPALAKIADARKADAATR